MTLKALLVPLLAVSIPAFAGPLVVGDYMENVPAETCKITTSNGLCSGTMVSAEFMVSARHCFENEPKEAFTITCTIKGKEYSSKIDQLKLSHDTYDAAVVKLKKPMPLDGMKIKYKVDSFVKSAELNTSTCAVIGFGINNTGKTGSINGVYLDRLTPSTSYFETIHLPAILEKRMNDMKYVYGVMKNTSATDTAVFKAMKNAITKGAPFGAKEAQEISAKDPEGTKRFFAILSEVMADEYQNELVSNKSNTFNYMLTTYHKSNLTMHTSGFLPGDSGGTVACKNSKKQWVLVGIISNIKVEKKMQIVDYGGLQFMNEVQVSTEGGAVPIVGEVLNFVRQSVKEIVR